MKNKALLLALFCLLPFLPACFGPEEAPAGNNQLRIGVMPSMDYLPLAVAERGGYFEEVGVDLQIVKFYSANQRDAAFQSGSVDGVVIDYTGAVLQKHGGVDLALTSRCDAPFYVLGAPQSGVSTFAELKGKSVAVSQNTVIDYLLDMALASAGLGPDDVNKVEINMIPLRFEMLMAGNIDSTGLPDPLASMARLEGAALLGSNADLGLSITGIMFSGKALAEKPELIRKMYQGYDRGAEYIAAHSPDDTGSVLPEILIGEMGFRPEMLAKTALPNYTRSTLPPLEDLQSVIDWLAARGLLGSDLSGPSLDASGLDTLGLVASELVNGSFLPQE